MSASDLRPDGDGDSDGEWSGRDPDVLAGELTVLREENERLREEYARARQSQYRRSAATLFGIGVLAFLAGAVVVNARTVLFALGGTGVFLGVLIYFLTPERFVSASVAEAVYASLAHNGSQAVAELGLEDEQVYVPLSTGDSTAGDDAGDSGGRPSEVRLFVPQHAEYSVPAASDLADLFVVTDDSRERGLSMRPSAADLYDDFAQAVTGDPSEDPGDLVDELRDGLVEQFELVESARAEADAAAGRAVVRVSGSAVGATDRFDHPVPSLLGVGLARAVGQPVTVVADPADGGGTEYVVTCAWTERSANEHEDEATTP